MDPPNFVISSAEATSMAETSNLSLPNFLPIMVQSAIPLSRTPISNYPVAAVGYGVSGRIYLGVNIEFPGLPLHHSIHAEQFLLTNLSLNNEPSLTYMAVSSAPCGHCRQFYQELRHAADVKILVTSDNNKENKEGYTMLSDFLPYRFGPHDLLDKNIPLLLEPRDNQLVLLLSPNIDENNVRRDLCNGGLKKGTFGFSNELLHAALEAANKSHAPYSSCPSGVALVDVEGKLYKGSYSESAAYNPSLGPVQAALVAFVAGGGGEYERIVGAVLVEREGSVVVKQEDTARLLLQVVAPKCEFRVVHCTKKSD